MCNFTMYNIHGSILIDLDIYYVLVKCLFYLLFAFSGPIKRSLKLDEWKKKRGII